MKEINAFALPDGPMYVNRGMIEAARTEGKLIPELPLHVMRPRRLSLSTARPMERVAAQCRSTDQIRSAEKSRIAQHSYRIRQNSMIVRAATTLHTQIYSSLPLRIAAITRGLRWPWRTAITHSGLSSGAQAIR